MKDIKIAFGMFVINTAIFYLFEEYYFLFLIFFVAGTWYIYASLKIQTNQPKEQRILIWALCLFSIVIFNTLVIFF